MVCTASENNERAISKIQSYANDFKHNTIPTLSDYHDAGVLNITEATLQKTNLHIVDIATKNTPSKYRYNPNQDYIYNFNQPTCKIITLPLENNTIHLKHFIPVKNESLFLKIVMSHTAMGTYFSPKITLDYKNKLYPHEFETGMNGIRYINISDLPLTKDSKIRIDRMFLTIPNQEVELIHCKKPQLKNKTILVIAPHPDDAEIASYGLYSKYADNVYIITVTAGEQGGNNYGSIYANPIEQYKVKGKFRTWNSLVIPLLGGVNIEHCLNLGFFDYTLASMFRHKKGIAEGSFTHISDINYFRKQNISSLARGLTGLANWTSLVDNYVYLLKKIQPDIIVTPYPAIDIHPDHQYASVALFEALKKAKINKGQLFMYTNHATYSEYYPYGKIGNAIDLPPSFKNDRFYFDNIYSFTLEDKVQKEKILVLDAMNDLRPNIDYYLKKEDYLASIQSNYSKNDKDITYFRRAIRANELFFIVDIKNIYDERVMSKLLAH